MAKTGSAAFLRAVAESVPRIILEASVGFLSAQAGMRAPAPAARGARAVATAALIPAWREARVMLRSGTARRCAEWVAEAVRPCPNDRRWRSGPKTMRRVPVPAEGEFRYCRPRPRPTTSRMAPRQSGQGHLHPMVGPTSNVDCAVGEESASLVPESRSDGRHLGTSTWLGRSPTLTNERDTSQ